MPRQYIGGGFVRQQQFNWKIPGVIGFCILCLYGALNGYQKLDVLNGINDFRDLESSVQENQIEEDRTKSHSIIVLVANFRDSKRCGETLHSIFTNISNPDNVVVAVHDQIIVPDEKSCVDTYCDVIPNCRRSQVRSTQVSAYEAKGPTVGRYMTEELIEDEDFCMTVDSHSIFVENWDTKVLSQWHAVKNENGIISSYPKGIIDMSFKQTRVNHMCYSHMQEGEDAMVEFGPLDSEPPGPVPRLCSQLAGGFAFGNCRQALEVRNDPYTPFLFHGEEYSRMARLWTHGYDVYCPNEDIVFHHYESRNTMFQMDWNSKAPIMAKSRRRIRYMMGLPITVNDVDPVNLHLFGLGKKRTFEQWKAFSNVDPGGPYMCSIMCRQFNACRDLEYVPYD